MNPWWIRDNLPQISLSQIKKLWYCDFWDIDLTGILVYNRNFCWYEQCEDDRDESNILTLYLLYELSEEQFANEQHWHKLFREHVGHHNDFEETGVSWLERIHKDSNPELFYGAYQSFKRPDYSENKIIGWFQTAFQATLSQAQAI